MQKKILVIDDLKEMRRVLEIRLKAEGYKVISACDGQEGIEKVRKEKPDLVITDLAVPKMNGHVIVRILKGSPDFRNIPVVMLSSFVDENMKRRLELGADAYFPKSCDPVVFMAKIRELLGPG